MNEKLVFIGAGPSTLFSVLYLLENGIEGSNIIIIDKGKNPYERNPKDLLYGFGGAGLFSDCKLVFSETTDTISHLISDKKKYFDLIKKYIYEFHPDPDAITISYPTDYECKSDLQLIQSECWHVGSDYGLIIGKKIYNYFREKGVKIVFENEVVSINLEDNEIQMVDELGDRFIYYDYLQIGTGKIGGKDILTNCYNEFGIPIKKGAIHFGGRFETEITPEILNIVNNIQYDFKFEKKYNENLRIRTFCCNTGNAHVVKELTPQGVQFNGHSYKNKNLNDLCNFGIIMEIKGEEWTEERLLKGLEEGICCEEEPKFESSLKEKFQNKLYMSLGLWDFRKELNDFVIQLNKELNFGKNCRTYFPEIKQSIGIIETDEYFRLEDGRFNNVAWVGDACTGSRGIVPAAITGLKSVEKLIQN